MKMMLRKLSVLLMAVMMASCMTAVAFADGETTEEPEPTVAGLAIPYGLYEPTETELYRSKRGMTITCNRVHVTNEFAADITFSSAKYTKLVVDGVEYKPYVDEDASTTKFTIPVKLGKEMTITGTTVAMSSPQDIDYKITVNLDKDNLKPAALGKLTDGYYTTTVSSKRESYGYVVKDDGSVVYGFDNPDGDYDIPVTIQIKDGKIADVAYTSDITKITGNTNSDINYLLWTIEGHNVTEDTYKYMFKNDRTKSSPSQYYKYHLDPYFPDRNGVGLKEQFIEKNGIAGVDTVTKATITSRAVIDSVDQSLTKAERGWKDDPEPELPKEDTEVVVPDDGMYSVTGKCIGADLGNDGEILLEVKDGKMTAKKFYVEQRPSSYNEIYPGTVAEAIEAGAEGWFKPEDYDYGYYTSSGTFAPGSLFTDVPIRTLDKPLRFAMHTQSGSGKSDAWYNRIITFDSSTLKALSESEVALENAQADYLVAEAAAKTAEQAVAKAIDKDGATVESIKTANDAYAAATKEAQNKLEALNEAKDVVAEEKEEAVKAAEEAKEAAEAAQKDAEEKKADADKEAADAKKAAETAAQKQADAEAAQKQAESDKTASDAAKAKAEADAKAAQEASAKAAADLKAAQDAQAKAEADLKKANEDLTQAKADLEKATAAAADTSKLDELTVKAQQVKKVKAKKGKKKATVSWKSLGKGYKYQVYVSTKAEKGFKKKATSSKVKTVVKKLKSKKTYYIKVRGFKTVNGKNVYTAFSDIAKVKVK